MWFWLLAGVGALSYFKGGDVVDYVETKLPDWNRFDALFQQSGALYGVDWQWLKAIALNESSLGKASSVAIGLETPNDIEGSQSSDGKSWGLMQVTISTAQSLDPYATEIKLNDPAYSVDLSAKYFGQLKRQFDESDPRFTEWVIKSYNQGPGNTRKEKNKIIKQGYADEYWARFQRNLTRVQESA